MDLECINPVTGGLIATLSVSTRRDIDSKIDTAKRGLPFWQELPLKERARYLTRARKRLVLKMDEIMDTILKETGKTEFDALVEVLVTSEIMRFVAKKGPSVLSDERRRIGLLKTKRGSVHHLPYGVVGIISPWNYPLILTAGPVVQALMAGNGVLLKPSEHTPLTAIKMKEIFSESGLPDEILQVAVGAGNVGRQIVHSSETRFICFTGSVDAGREIAVACAEQLKPIILELGGKDPVIVLEDADLERAAKAVVWGGFHNAGQTCISVERVYVEESVADRFIERVTELARRVRTGPGMDDSDFGSMTTEKQRKSVHLQVEDSKRKGGRIAVGGGDGFGQEAFFIQPKVVVDVNSSMELMREETFGPVIAISKVKDAEEALAQANSLKFGLNASIFTTDTRKARRMAKRVQAGSICINDVLANYLCVDLPFGGVRDSGMGRLQGVEGIRNFTQIQSVCEDRFGLKKEPWWFPVSNEVKTLFRSFVKLWYG